MARSALAVDPDRSHPDVAETILATGRLLTEVEVAAALSVSVATLRSWRTRGGKVPFVRIGAAVRYRPADVEAYISGHTYLSTSQADA